MMNRTHKSVNIFENKEIRAALYLLLAGFLLMLFATRSSFLYPCNDWNDANSYFSMGKALFNGKMPYRDVFDQKGPYLYFLYGLAYLVSHTTFAGVFILEVICAFLDLVGIYYILRLYLKRNTALFFSPLTLAVAVSSKSFYWGGSAEEICYPLLVWGLYLSIEYFKNSYPQKPMGFKVIFGGGLLAGVAANIKFTVLGFFFAWMMCVAFSFLVRKDFFGAVKGCVVFLLGMAVPFIPWLIYFGANHGLYEWYWGYVHINVFIYSDLNEKGPGLFERVYILSKLLYWLIRDNLIYFAFLIPGVLLFFCLGKKKMAGAISSAGALFFPVSGNLRGWLVPSLLRVAAVGFHGVRICVSWAYVGIFYGKTGYKRKLVRPAFGRTAASGGAGFCAGGVRGNYLDMLHEYSSYEGKKGRYLFI